MALSASAASAASFNCDVPLDNFNRVDSGTLGPNWTVQSPSMTIETNAATNPNSTAGLATWNATVPTQQACVDVNDNGTSLQYAAITLGYANNENNAFVKVQNNSAAGFDIVYFYYGNNGSCKIAGGCNFAITTPFHAGRLHAALNPATAEVTLDIDTNFDNVPEQTITKTYNAPFSFGNAIGIGSYGHAYLDNFATVSAPPGPPPPPAPPAAPNTKLKRANIKPNQGFAKFTFGATGTATGFQCALAKKGKKLTYKSCKSPKAYKHLKAGKYTFKVRAVGPGGTDSSPVTQKFRIN
ncbi:MAG TPA: hypothetical protein VFI17_08870 [Solirubrobacterales bacterium]|nr:hypothetical protein [Solirubrobacterales bacterium]